jgi:hypothetical protein
VRQVKPGGDFAGHGRAKPAGVAKTEGLEPHPFKKPHREPTALIDGFRYQVQQNVRDEMLGTILLIILILLLIGALPTWPYSGGWGYYPTGGVGLLLIIVIVLLVAGRI